ncbi:MAG: ribonuclease III [Lactobacillales bacterium]|jgi:ribonuclease-3|nr:ribonuclease III [Lactobacillales bacterium]
MTKINDLLARFGVEVSDGALYQVALTHSSYANENGGIEYNERIEFLGDAVLELIVSRFLYDAFPERAEGELTKFRANLVCEKSLAALAVELGFDKLLLLGRGEELGGGRTRPAILCDLFESILGAIYLDLGYEVARKFIETTLLVDVESAETIEKMDPKTYLQELLQVKKNIKIEYRVIREYRIDNDTVFDVGVFVDDKLLAEGSGYSKKKASLEAARLALEEKRYAEI